MNLILYHGSSHIVEFPSLDKGKRNNDYGQGFYCTESADLAKEWACISEMGGYANQYTLDTKNLSILNLMDKHILCWIALLVENRTFDLKSNLAREAKDYLKQEFLIDLSQYDVIEGYRADDSYFAFASAFLNGTLSLNQLSRAMKLGDLETQVVMKSGLAFKTIRFTGYEEVRPSIYYQKRIKRDRNARIEFQKIQGEIKASESIYMLDILRGGLKQNDILL